ncbi:MAG: DUF2723 domain-containing protein [Muribaculaceae bacterium]|nr:DUF2723 domain-containing protein [Muribaculaceae bacterium]
MALSPLQKYKIPLSISSWATLAVSLFFYWLTVDPGVSYWDCPEYVVAASRLEVGHPPGNPIWILAMRVATIPFPAESHALVINLCSGLFMAFAAFFLCRLIFIPSRLLLLKSPARHLLPPSIADLVAGLVAFGGSLCFALCDSAWFSALEAEVYALSTLLSALSLWIVMVWWWEKSWGRRVRLLILLSYLMGLSLGVHQLNLLLIPVFALAIFYRSRRGRVAPLRVLLLVGAAAVGIGFILMGFMPGMLFGAGVFELFTVNRLGWPYNSGEILFGVLVAGAAIVALCLIPYRKTAWIGVWMFSFLFLGFSSFAIFQIRASAYTPMNEGAPSNIFALAAYINRDQYPSSPLIYGHTPYSQPLFMEKFVEGKPLYSRYILEKGKALYSPVFSEGIFNYRSGMLTPLDSLLNNEISQRGHGYVIADYEFQQKLTPELDMWLPRMTSRKGADISAYADWAGMTKENMERVAVSETIDSTGHPQPLLNKGGLRREAFSYRPTYIQNLRFFLAYQAYYMYLRYLFWNFIGRQNDYPSMGEIEHGNFLTGIPFIDSRWLGSTREMPSEIGQNNPGRNHYFAIPFALGLLGILWLICSGRYSRRLLSLIFLLFLMTGLAIVAYLNQAPGEPRERDYTFLVSYMAFTMWIAAGMLALIFLFLKLNAKTLRNENLKRGNLPNKKTSIIVATSAAVVALSPPALMAAENFDDHDRRNRFETLFYASSLFDYEIPSIIFSYGDNATFPLWYASEMDYREKGTHSVVDVTYLSLPSYVANLKKQGERGVSTLSATPQISYGAFVITRIPNDSMATPMPLAEALKNFYASPDFRESFPHFPASRVTLPSSSGDSVILNLRDLSGGSYYLPFRQLMLLDLMASQIEAPNPKPLYFPYFGDNSFSRGLQPALRQALFGRIYAPWISDSILALSMDREILREMDKLSALEIKPHYVDPLIADQSVRYRGQLWLGARWLLERGDSVKALELAHIILQKFPYDTLLPGSFTLADSTFYEGREALMVIKNLRKFRDDTWLAEKEDSIASIIEKRRGEWKDYYLSLPKSQRTALSNRSKRLIAY